MSHLLEKSLMENFIFCAMDLYKYDFACAATVTRLDAAKLAIPKINSSRKIIEISGKTLSLFLIIIRSEGE